MIPRNDLSAPFGAVVPDWDHAAIANAARADRFSRPPEHQQHQLQFQPPHSAPGFPHVFHNALQNTPQHHEPRFSPPGADDNKVFDHHEGELELPSEAFGGSPSQGPGSVNGPGALLNSPDTLGPEDRFIRIDTENGNQFAQVYSGYEARGHGLPAPPVDLGRCHDSGVSWQPSSVLPNFSLPQLGPNDSFGQGEGDYDMYDQSAASMAPPGLHSPMPSFAEGLPSSSPGRGPPHSPMGPFPAPMDHESSSSSASSACSPMFGLGDLSSHVPPQSGPGTASSRASFRETPGVVASRASSRPSSARSPSPLMEVPPCMASPDTGRGHSVPAASAEATTELATLVAAEPDGCCSPSGSTRSVSSSASTSMVSSASTTAASFASSLASSPIKQEQAPSIAPVDASGTPFSRFLLRLDRKPSFHRLCVQNGQPKEHKFLYIESPEEQRGALSPDRLQFQFTLLQSLPELKLHFTLVRHDTPPLPPHQKRKVKSGRWRDLHHEIEKCTVTAAGGAGAGAPVTTLTATVGGRTADSCFQSFVKAEVWGRRGPKSINRVCCTLIMEASYVPAGSPIRKEIPKMTTSHNFVIVTRKASKHSRSDSVKIDNLLHDMSRDQLLEYIKQQHSHSTMKKQRDNRAKMERMVRKAKQASFLLHLELSTANLPLASLRSVLLWIVKFALSHGGAVAVYPHAHVLSERSAAERERILAAPRPCDGPGEDTARFSVSLVMRGMSVAKLDDDEDMPRQAALSYAKLRAALARICGNHLVFGAIECVDVIDASVGLDSVGPMVSCAKESHQEEDNYAAPLDTAETPGEVVWPHGAPAGLQILRDECFRASECSWRSKFSPHEERMDAPGAKALLGCAGDSCAPSSSAGGLGSDLTGGCDEDELTANEKTSAKLGGDPLSSLDASGLEPLEERQRLSTSNSSGRSSIKERLHKRRCLKLRLKLQEEENQPAAPAAAGSVAAAPAALPDEDVESPVFLEKDSLALEVALGDAEPSVGALQAVVVAPGVDEELSEGVCPETGADAAAPAAAAAAEAGRRGRLASLGGSSPRSSPASRRKDGVRLSFFDGQLGSSPAADSAEHVSLPAALSLVSDDASCAVEALQAEPIESCESGVPPLPVPSKPAAASLDDASAAAAVAAAGLASSGDDRDSASESGSEISVLEHPRLFLEASESYGGCDDPLSSGSGSSSDSASGDEQKDLGESFRRPKLRHRFWERIQASRLGKRWRARQQRKLHSHRTEDSGRSLLLSDCSGSESESDNERPTNTLGSVAALNTLGVGATPMGESYICPSGQLSFQCPKRMCAGIFVPTSFAQPLSLGGETFLGPLGGTQLPGERGPSGGARLALGLPPSSPRAATLSSSSTNKAKVARISVRHACAHKKGGGTTGTKTMRMFSFQPATKALSSFDGRLNRQSDAVPTRGEWAKDLGSKHREAQQRQQQGEATHDHTIPIAAAGLARAPGPVQHQQRERRNSCPC